MGMPVKPALTLALTAAVLTALVVLVASFTRDRIASNEQAWIRQRLDALVPPATHEHHLVAAPIAAPPPVLLGSPQPTKISPARRAGAPVAAVLRPIAPDGYRGPIELL